MKLHRHKNAAEFLLDAEDWLLSGEAENNIVLGMAQQNARAPSLADGNTSQYWATLHDAGQVVGCAFRTPPYLFAVTDLPPDAVDMLADDALDFYAELPGVGGPREAACQFANSWTARTDTTWSIRTGLLIHELTSVQHPPDSPNGDLRQVSDADFGLVQRWVTAFVHDTGIVISPEDYLASLRASPNLFIWEDAGPRCLVAATRDTPNGSCVNAVYTPREFRRRGYASAAVATLSARLLERGRKFCCLYTDAANPTSNSIYQKIGYRPVREDVDIDFSGPAETEQP